jgi:hypothetical protein
MLADPEQILLVEPERAPRRVVFLTYQRTTFTDALRTATCLRRHGAYSPVFLVCEGKAGLVAPQVQECHRLGISCFTEEELLSRGWRASFEAGDDIPTHSSYRSQEGSRNAARPGRAPLWVKLRQRAGIASVALTRLVAKRRRERVFEAWRRSALGHWQLKRGRLKAFKLARAGASCGLVAALLRAELNFRRILQRLAPDIVCLSEDIPEIFSSPFIRAARRKRIPSVIIPFTIPNVLELAEDRLAQKRSWLARLDERVAALAYPRWGMQYKGRLLLRANPGLIDALERRGLAPPNPWMTNSGYADRIAVESERMFSVYRNAHFPERQLALTGSCADDLLFAALRDKDARRSAVYRELGLPDDLPMLLSSLVPDQLGSGVPRCEFKEYVALIEFWVRTLAAWSQKMNVVLKINPRYGREQFLDLENWGVKVAPHDTIELVPLSDIYVASVSSTLRWAIACGIPSINYDVYHYRYGDFADVSGIVHVESKAEFSGAVAQLVEDKMHREELRRLQGLEAPRWARLDGRSTERLVGLLDGCVSGSTGGRSRLQRRVLRHQKSG